MTRIEERNRKLSVQQVSSVNQGAGKQRGLVPIGEFKDRLGAHLEYTGKNGFREADVFAAIVTEHVGQMGGEEALDFFLGAYDEHKANPRGSGDRGEIFAANRALKKVRVNGYLTRDDAHTIRARSFGAAQLDDDPLSLTGVGAKHSLDSVLGQADSKIAAYDSGAEVPLTRAERKALKAGSVDTKA